MKSNPCVLEQRRAERQACDMLHVDEHGTQIKNIQIIQFLTIVTQFSFILFVTHVIQPPISTIKVVVGFSEFVIGTFTFFHECG